MKQQFRALRRSGTWREFCRMAWHVLVVWTALGRPGSDSMAANSEGREAPATHFVIGLSPFLNNTNKDEVYRSIVRLMVSDLPLDSTLAIYDAYNLKTVTQLALPNVQAFKSPKTRANQFAPAIRELKLFLAAEHVAPTNDRLSFVAAVRLPQFLDFLAETPATTSNATVLLIGSPLYQDAKEPGFSMTDGYFPSDGHLQASRDKSIFGIYGEHPALPVLGLYWAYFGDPWLNELYRDKVQRFWALYCQRRGCQLEAFTGDLPGALQSFEQRHAAGLALAHHWTIDEVQTKIEMLRVSRGVEIADWLTRDTVAIGNQLPPGRLVGPMKIGIRWKEKVDLDLYATPRSGAETLFFQHVRSPEGYYYKDHRSSPGREYEFIEFESPVDVREIEAFVNFYKGSWPGGAQGEIRIEFDGRVYGAPFSIPADHGNQGRTGESQQEFWTPIPIQQILKLNPPPSRAG